MQNDPPPIAPSPAAVLLPEKGSLSYFTVLCFIAAIGGFLFGFDTAVISGINPLLEKQFHLENQPLMRGWVVSSALVGCVIGSMLAGLLSDLFGRKRILVVSGTLFGLSALGCSLAPSPLILSIPRLIGGLGVGVAGMVVPLYIAEISPARLRGRMVTFYQLAITIGILLAYFSNAAFHEYSISEGSAGLSGFFRWLLVDEVWRGMIASMFIPAAGFLVLLLIVPESPRWLTMRGLEERALSILARIAGRRTAEAELGEIRAVLSEEPGDFGQLFRPGTKRALVLAVFLACSAQLSGINAIIYFGPSILEKAGFRLGEALGGQVVLGIVNVLFTVLAIWKVDTMGRRPLLIWGSAGCCASLAVVGTLFAAGMTEGYFVILFMCTYLACFAFSLGPVPWVIMSEVFPTKIRGLAMSIATLCLWVANTIVCQAFPYLVDNLGSAGTFWIFAALVFPAIVYSIRAMPETKGKSLEELERYFAGRG
jgi:SP family arabinose:H+ symporter-like MFS transporter